MKKQRTIIISGVILLGLIVSVYQYIIVMMPELVGAADTKPAAGHSWSEMESDEDSIQVSGRTITNLAAPVASTDATNKEYVDNLLRLPEGGEPGDTLIMGVTGPYWDSILTWAGSSKTARDCDLVGGTVFDTGSGGTICRLSSASVPAGWSQAANWQKYSPTTWGGDYCGRHLNTGPGLFSNVSAVVYSARNIWPDDYEYINYVGYCSQTNPIYYIVYDSSLVRVNQFGLKTTYINPTTNRVEVGVY